MSKRQQLDARDRALIAEVVGFLQGYVAGYNSDDHQYRFAEPLAARLKELRAKLWPVDRKPRR